MQTIRINEKKMRTIQINSPRGCLCSHERESEMGSTVHLKRIIPHQDSLFYTTPQDSVVKYHNDDDKLTFFSFHDHHSVLHVFDLDHYYSSEVDMMRTQSVNLNITDYDLSESFELLIL